MCDLTTPVVVSVVVAVAIVVVVVVVVVLNGVVKVVALRERPLVTEERVEELDGSAVGGTVVAVFFLEFRTAARSASRSMV